MITGLAAAFLALLQIALTVNVVAYRIKHRISMGDNADFELTRRIRAHGNLVETAPIFILLLLMAELQGVHPLYLVGLSLIFIAGRLLHVAGLLTGRGYGKLRMYGMLCTLGAILIAALCCVAVYFV